MKRKLQENEESYVREIGRIDITLSKKPNNIDPKTFIIKGLPENIEAQIQSIKNTIKYEGYNVPLSYGVTKKDKENYSVSIYADLETIMKNMKEYTLNFEEGLKNVEANLSEKGSINPIGIANIFIFRNL